MQFYVVKFINNIATFPPSSLLKHDLPIEIFKINNLPLWSGIFVNPASGSPNICYQDPKHWHVNCTLYRIEWKEGRGRCLVATTTIQPGQIIFRQVSKFSFLEIIFLPTLSFIPISLQPDAVDPRYFKL